MSDFKHYGFSGSKEPLTVAQMAYIDKIISELPKGSRVYTGACVGVDAYVARSAYSRGYYVHTIVPALRSHVDFQWEMWCHSYEEMPQGTTYRDRNIKIVERGRDGLIAFPLYEEDDPRSRRSGTWQTIRLAAKQDRWHVAYLLSEVV